MRLRLFDRIRRLAHFRRSPAETAPGASGAQGRHRRHRRGGPATAPGSLDFPDGPGFPAGSEALPAGRTRLAIARPAARGLVPAARAIRRRAPC